jgi:hypothetical protein
MAFASISERRGSLGPCVALRAWTYPFSRDAATSREICGSSSMATAPVRGDVCNGPTRQASAVCSDHRAQLRARCMEHLLVGVSPVPTPSAAESPTRQSKSGTLPGNLRSAIWEAATARENVATRSWSDQVGVGTWYQANQHPYVSHEPVRLLALVYDGVQLKYCQDCQWLGLRSPMPIHHRRSRERHGVTGNTTTHHRGGHVQSIPIRRAQRFSTV